MTSDSRKGSWESVFFVEGDRHETQQEDFWQVYLFWIKAITWE